MRMARFAAVLSLVCILAACAATRSDKRPRVGANQLNFEMSDLAGNTISLSDESFAGKVILVTLWGSWCPPCVSEIPTFKDLQDRLGPDGLEIVAIAFEKETDVVTRGDHLRTFTSQHEINYLVLDGGSTSDFSTALPMVDDVDGLPVEILIDRNGVVVDVRNGYGYSEKWALELGNRLVDLLRD